MIDNIFALYNRQHTNRKRLSFFELKRLFCVGFEMSREFVLMFFVDDVDSVGSFRFGSKGDVHR